MQNIGSNDNNKRGNGIKTKKVQLDGWHHILYLNHIWLGLGLPKTQTFTFFAHNLIFVSTRKLNNTEFQRKYCSR